ncbi:B-cell receptor-associated protein 31-like-domain-containing protein [Zychaea mexicana]|uniref:B-cell receptor-associated protein 31-like-domain-containing protein n=1 Tax=Zychaea mexicana TaxID=64656 RepID=UPI0022FEB710|nr:B-cell receptor-associated protein 31-like-domain-containing protein [Zychaea mexicana]KAI9493468.1 B-cell receptor-associated protein 31-like-domain-containing protein [Zychaea mexicana]
MIVFCLVVLPLPMHWRRAMMRAFKSSPVVAKALYALKIIFAFIFLLFIDTFNRLQRIGEEAEQEEGHHHDYSFEASLKAKRFYAQRNLYLTGFTLFLSLILERTTALVVDMLEREEQLQHMKKESATANDDTNRLVEIDSSYKKQIDDLKAEIGALKKQRPDFESLKKRAGQQSTEYDQLVKERDALLKK